MDETVDIRIETTEELRTKFKAACAFENMTYEELLEELLDFRVEYDDEWESRHEESSTRRSSGAGE